MPISPGTRLGPYEVVAPLGAGGMGEVWKARDTRLERSVAIKVLPAEFSQNAQLKLRFEREARTISQLEHPNICRLYDVGEDYLVMELLNGETLADRIAHGALPMPEVLRIGAEIADALDRAHRARIIHRDLKPANVMLTRTGAKLLDFGLAKSGVASVADVSAATEAKPLTEEGTILGTFQYMAPEQLEGEDADARTDIFALGALLYEMATGKRAFEGKTKASLIAAILRGEPRPISEMQPLTPPSFEHVVKKCIAKHRDDRWQSAHDVAEELRWISEVEPQAGSASSVAKQNRKRQRFSSVIIALAVGAVAAAAAWFGIKRWTTNRDDSIVYRATIPTAPGTVLQPRGGTMALSPDGKMLAYASLGRDGSALLVRKLSETTWRVLDGTTGATAPFWSPDSRQIAFAARGSLWKIAADGSAAPDELSRVSGSAEGTWSADGTILFTTDTKLWRVRSSGGNPVEVKPLPNVMAVQPFFLPDERHFLFRAVPFAADAAVGNNTCFIGDLQGIDAPKEIARGQLPEFSDGYLFFVRGGVLYAQLLDMKRLAVSGDAKGITKVETFNGELAFYSVAGETLVYLPEASVVRTELQRVDRGGKTMATIGAPAFYFSPRISHDGTRVAIDNSDNDQTKGDIWILDVATAASTRFTFAAENESGPAWDPNDSHIAYFTRPRGTKQVIMSKPVDGGEASAVIEPPQFAETGEWAPDGKTYVGTTTDAPRAPPRVTFYSLPEWQQFGPRIEGRGPRFSPDGRWFAYSVKESSRVAEVFVQPFPPNGSKWQVSTSGGSMPVWSRDGKSLFFVSPDGNMMESRIVPGAKSSFALQHPQPLFRVTLREGSSAEYDVFPDGTFLVNRIPDSASTPMTMVIHWKAALGQ